MSPLVSCIFQRNTATEAVAREWLSGMEAQRGSLFNGPLISWKIQVGEMMYGNPPVKQAGFRRKQ